MSTKGIRLGLVLMLALVTGAGCASSGGGGGGGSDDYNTLTSWEMTEVQSLNALDAIRRLRPRWLRARTSGGPVSGGAGMYGIMLHIDNTPQQGVEVLETLPAADVQQMRFLPGPEATTRFGTNYTNGVILVTTEG